MRNNWARARYIFATVEEMLDRIQRAQKPGVCMTLLERHGRANSHDRWSPDRYLHNVCEGIRRTGLGVNDGDAGSTHLSPESRPAA